MKNMTSVREVEESRNKFLLAHSALHKKLKRLEEKDKNTIKFRIMSFLNRKYV